MKKILISFLTVAIVGSSAVGVTRAYFTGTANSTGNTFAAGTMLISILEQNSVDKAFLSEILKTNWQPGEDVLVSFDVKNTGTLPVELRGFATGTWSGGWDPSNVKVTRVERWNGAAWENVVPLTPSGITGYFYYTNTGLSSGTYFDVAPGDRAQLRLTVNLDSGTLNTYQGQLFTTTLQVDAKQATPGSTF